MVSGGIIRQKNKSALAAVATTSTAAAAASFISLSHKPSSSSSSSLPIALDFISKRYKYDNAHHNENSRDIMTASTSWRLSDYSRRISNTTIISNAKRSFTSNSSSSSKSSSSSSSSDNTQNITTTPSLSLQPTNNRKASSTTIWQPNQTTSTFTKMLNTNDASGRLSSNNTNNHNCKEIISAYAQCVITKQNKGVLTKGVCEKEYNALMDCFRAARLA